jgi:hypothetical protein
MRNEGKLWGSLALAGCAVGIWPGPQLAQEFRRAPEPAPVLQNIQVVKPTPRVEPASVTPASWIESVRPYCNDRDVDLHTDLNPPPATDEGMAHEAACFALAGRIAKARALILGLPEDQHTEAAGIVYDVAMATLVADTNAAVGPIMELVLEFWPNHYLALYHAGSARYMSGDMIGAGPYLERFLDLYVREDRRTADARRMLLTAQER